jgi:hypothetical protein
MRLGLGQIFAYQLLRVGPDDDVISVVELESHNPRDVF